MIRPVDLNGMIQRTDDIGLFKHQEEQKPVIDQQSIQVQVDQREDDLFHQVSQSEESAQTRNDADAREEGNGTYVAAGNAKRKKKKAALGDGRVIKKKPGGGFDITI